MARLFALVALFLAGCAAEQQIPTPNEVLGADLPRAALVIGNGSYESVAPLRNPAADAGAIAGALKSAGYRVHKGGALVDLDRTEMEREIAAFAAAVSRTGGIAFVYYAGHGLQVDGRNYLIPVDAGIATTSEIPSETVDLQLLLSALEAPNIEMKVIVIDACRDNPFELATAEKPTGSRTGRGDPGLRSLSSGLSELIAPPGALVAFATAPGSVALDGEGQNSPYAAALANVVGEPGLRVEDVFISVRNRVRAETRGVQVPWETSSLTSVAAFSGEARTSGETTPIFAEPPPTRAWDGEYFAELRCAGDGSSPPVYRAYLPTVRQGRARSTLVGDIEEAVEWLFAVDGSVRVRGEGSFGSDRWAIDLGGQMKNDAAKMPGILGQRDCTIEIWRSTSPVTPMRDMKFLSGDAMKEIISGNTFVSESGYMQYFDPSGKTTIRSRVGIGRFHTRTYNWAVRGDAWCTDWEGEMKCRSGELMGRRDPDGWKLVSVERTRGRAWPVKVVEGKAF